MIAFLLKVWGLARPYRGRLSLGVLTGIISGFIEPLMIATIAFVYALIFPSAGSPKLSVTLDWVPPFLKDWLTAAQEALRTGVSTNPAAVVALVAVIPAVIFLRGFFSYLNIYFLQWTGVRAITDLRVRLFEHLMNQSASFFNRTNTGELMSRILNDTGAVQSVISN